jgi:hypothetical protein
MASDLPWTLLYCDFHLSFTLLHLLEWGSIRKLSRTRNKKLGKLPKSAIQLSLLGSYSPGVDQGQQRPER